MLRLKPSVSYFQDRILDVKIDCLGKSLEIVEFHLKLLKRHGLACLQFYDVIYFLSK